MLAALALALLPSAPLAQDRDGAESAPIQVAVGGAIERCLRYLLDEQLRDGSWPGHRPGFPAGQTALSVYTLLSCGLEEEHPAVLRALRFLEHTEPRRVYSVSAALLAYGALNEPAHAEQMEALLETLLDWRKEAWDYPGPNERRAREKGNGRIDLSNTQFALMGLRAAAHAGLEVPVKDLRGLVPAILGFRRAAVQAAEPRGEDGDRPPGGVGFTYFQSGRDETGSMTAAGVASLQIASELLGDRLSASEARAAARATEAGLAWLEENWTVTRNPRPNGPDGVLYRIYYLYCLERLGALLPADRIGEHDWYAEGARELVRRQEEDGRWEEVDPWSDTCFALLFLARATRPHTGTAMRTRSLDAPDAGNRSGPVRLRAVGDPRTKLWITSLAGQELRVEAVEYRIDGELAHTVAGDPSAAWNGEPFAARHLFRTRGVHRLGARVRLADGRVLEGSELELVIRDPFAEWMLDAAGALERNAIAGAERTTQASSSLGPEHGSDAAFDGREDTFWASAPTDRTPTLHLELEKPLRATRLVLGQCVSKVSDLGRRDPIRELELFVNLSKRPIRVELSPDVLAPTSIDLPRGILVRTITLHVLERGEGAEVASVGFSEVALECGR